MQTSIKTQNEVEFSLELNATADDLAVELKKALKEQRRRTTMHGFRPGKVPLSLVKKMHGQAIGEAVAADFIQKVYQEQVLDVGKYEVLGQPVISTFEYNFEGDLHSVLEFGVRPDFEPADLSGEKISQLVHSVSDDDVQREIDKLLEQEADLVPIDEPADDAAFVVVDMQSVDIATGTLIVGAKRENEAFLLSDPEVMPEIKSALVGKRVDDTVRVTLTHAHGEDEETHEHKDVFELTVKEVKRRELPELDEEFIKSVTKDRIEDEDTLRTEIRDHLIDGWAQRSKEALEQEIVERVIDRNPIPVPSSVANMYLDSFVKELEKRFNDKLPANFDEANYREYRRNDAVRQARWMFVRDHLIKAEELEITDDDRRSHLESMAGDNPALDVDMLMQYYQVSQGLMDQLDQRLLNDKVFALLEPKFEIEEKDLDAYEAEMEARHSAANSSKIEGVESEDELDNADNPVVAEVTND